MDILLVEDNTKDAELLRRTLARTFEPSTVSLVEDVASAREHLSRRRFDVVLLDLGLPDSDGLETLHQVQAANAAIPIVVMSDGDDNGLALAAVHEGADDYMIKGDHRPSSLLRSIKYAMQRKSDTGKSIATPESPSGLPPRESAWEQLNIAIAAALSQAKGTSRKVAVMIVDVDHFSNVNESFGRAIGDTFLHRITDTIADCLRESDRISRLDGDRLAVVSLAAKGVKEIEAVADRIHRALRAPIVIDGHSVTVTVSIGIAVAPENGVTPAEIRQSASLALRDAKDQGRDCTRFFSHETNELLQQYHEKRREFGTAVQLRQFAAHYQPRFTAKGKLVHSVAASCFWRHPEQGLLATQDFMHLAMDFGYDARIQECVLPMIAGDLFGWRQIAEQVAPVAFTLAPTEMSNALLVEKLQRLISEFSLPASSLELGFTEQVLTESSNQAIDNITRLHKLGMRIAIVDFGMGIGPVRQLARLPIDSVNIDASLVSAMDDPANLGLIKSIVAMGHALGLTVTAAGVEHYSQADRLKDLGCDALQGDFFVSTMNADATLRYLLET